MCSQAGLTWARVSCVGRSWGRRAFSWAADRRSRKPTPISGRTPLHAGSSSGLTMARLVERSKSARASMTCRHGAGEAVSPGLVGSLPQPRSQEEPQDKNGAGAGAWPDVLPDQVPLPWHPYSCGHIVPRLPQKARGQELNSAGCPSTRCPWGCPGTAHASLPGAWLTRPCCRRVPAAAHASRLCSTAPRGSCSHARSCSSSGLRKQARAPSLHRKSLLTGKGS